MPSAAVISIDSGTSTVSATKPPSFSSSHDALAVSFTAKNVEGSEKYIVLGPNELYPFADVNDANLFQVLGLLTDCTKIMEIAQRIDPTLNYIDFDEQMMQARAVLRNLFGLRSIGDGFASVINGILWALKNKDTDTLSRKQTAVILESIRELKRKPLMHFDTAMSILDSLEEADLAIEPSLIDELVDLA